MSDEESKILEESSFTTNWSEEICHSANLVEFYTEANKWLFSQKVFATTAKTSCIR